MFWVARGDVRDKKTILAWALLARPQIYNLDARQLIAVLKKVRYALCPMPYALCPMPYAHEYLIFLRKAI